MERLMQTVVCALAIATSLTQTARPAGDVRAAAEESSSEIRRLAAPDSGTVKASEAGPSAKTEDARADVSAKKWTVKLGGHVQGDLINWATASPAIVDAKDYFEFRRLRLVADGTGYETYDFRLQMTLEPETVGTNPPGIVTSPDVKDAYFSMNEIPWLGRFRIGNFFVPFSLEQVTNDTYNAFLERSIPTQGVFAVDREVGIAFYNSNDDHSITWTYGVFLDSISEALKERIDDNQGTRVSGRVTWLPYYDEPSQGRYLVHTGVGILYTDDYDNRFRLRTRPQIREGPFLIDTGPLDASSYTTGNLEAAIVYGSFAIQSEAFLSTASLDGGDEQTTSGAYVHATYFLTGENRIFERFGQHGAQFVRNVPKRNFLIVPGSISPAPGKSKVAGPISTWINSTPVSTTTSPSASTGTGPIARASCSTGFIQSPARRRFSAQHKRISWRCVLISIGDATSACDSGSSSL